MENIAKALIAFQKDIDSVPKTAKNPFFKSSYAPLDEVKKAAQPHLSKNKLAVVQMMAHIDGTPALRTIILHESGESIEDITPLFLDKQNSQGHGSAVTYARRYGFMSALGLVSDEDDDGNKASSPSKKGYYKPDPSKEASDQQKLFIANLLRQHGVNKDGMPDYLATNYGILPEAKMSQADAQMIIDDLNMDRNAK